MATPEEIVVGAAADDEVLVDGEMLGPDPVDTTSKELKEEAGEAEGKEEKKECGKGLDQIKTPLLISGAVVALIGAIFAVVKQIKHA